jgi:phage tail protein X
MALDTIVTRDRDTVDGAIWRERGLGTADLARVLTLNPGLAGQGAILPAGIEIRVPPPAEAAPPRLEQVQLWS